MSVRLTDAELEDLANNINLDESDVDEDLLLGSDDDDEEIFPAAQGVGIVGANQDTIPDDNDFASNRSASSDEDIPLINYLPRSKKRKWKRTNFEPKIENYELAIHVPMLPEAIPEPIDYFTKYLDDSFFESIAMYTNMKEVKKTGKFLDTNAEELKHFFAACMLIGIYNLLMFFKQPEEDSGSESDSPDEEPSAKRRKIIPIPDKRIRKKDSKHLPEFTKDSQKSRSKCRNPGCRSLTFSKCSACQMYLCCSVQRNCFSTFHR